MGRVWRGAAGLTFRRCLTKAALPTLVATLLAALGAHHFRAELGDESSPAAASPWLALPIAVAMFVCLGNAALFWPGFARGRPGRDQLDRLQRSSLAGCGAVITGALVAQCVLVLPLTTAFAAWLGAPPAVRTHVALVPPPEPVLLPQQPRLEFVAPANLVCDELVIRPLAALPIGTLQATIVEVLADGTSLGTVPHGFTETRQVARLQFAPRSISRLELVFRSGTVPLVFPEESLVLVGAAGHTTVGNGVLAAAIACLPSFVTLAFACLAGALATLPTVLATVLVLQIVQLLGDVGPFAPATLALLRGQWLGTTVFQASATSLAVGCLAMIGAMMLRRRGRR
jgi:hypothetical protein